MKRILIFNVKYSSNVGDGIIAECLEEALSRANNVMTYDIGGREEFGGSGVIKNPFLKEVLQSAASRAPERIGRFFKNRLSDRVIEKRFKPLWREKARGADLIVIGGGQLLADTDHYFPPRIKAVTDIAQALHTPFKLHAVGVSDPDRYAEAARKMFEEAFLHNPYFKGGTVRDGGSLRHWRKLFPRIDIGLSRDPGLLACDRYADIVKKSLSVKQKREDGKKVIGVGVMSLEALRSCDPPPRSGDEDFFILLAKELCDAGHKVCFFTNGAPEDEATLEGIRGGNFGKYVKDIYFAARPLIPADLARIIAGCDAVIAHRLHANIVAYSFGIPNIGLGWDKKLSAFCASVRRENFIFEEGIKAQEIALAVSAALKTGISEKERLIYVAEAREGCASLSKINDLTAAGERVTG